MLLKKVNAAPSVSSKPTSTDLVPTGTSSHASSTQSNTIKDIVSAKPSSAKVAESFLENATFEEQFRSYSTLGFAISPSGQIVGDPEQYFKHQHGNTTKLPRSQEEKEESVQSSKRKRIETASLSSHADDIENWRGPWRKPEPVLHVLPEQVATEVSHPKPVSDHTASHTISPSTTTSKAKSGTMALLSAGAAQSTGNFATGAAVYEVVNDSVSSTPALKGISSSFHGGQVIDYQGRSWFEPPPGLHVENELDHECFLPKKSKYKFTNHTKGVQHISFFPHTGHLLLSASMDASCMIFSTGKDKHQLMRKYIGHSAAVRQSVFRPSDGHRFMSMSYDKSSIVWDSETGHCIRKFSFESNPLCGSWYPRDENLVLFGTNHRKILQYDLRVKEDDPVLIYDYHLGPVNTLLFFNDGNSFVSTSDDKKMLVWDFNAPVPTNYISDPSMFSITNTYLASDESFFVAQASNNEISIYNAGEKVSLNKKRNFKGHLTAGYACGLSISPDKKFLASGDGEGSLFFWDFHTSKMIKKVQNVHSNGPCISVAWHPLEPSTVATAGWDGVIQIHQ
jgi:pre-mRNA-processing factor 17